MNVLSRSLIFLLALHLSAESSFGQNSVSDFLLTAFEDGNLTEYSRKMDFITPRNTQIPVIDELEMRMSNDELTYKDLSYQLRLRPANPWQIRRNNALFNATRKELGLQQQLEFKNNLMRRYKLLLDYFEQTELVDLYQNKQRLAVQRTHLFLESFDSDIFDARDFSKAKLDEVEELGSLNEAMSLLLYIRQEITLVLGVEPSWADFPLVEAVQVDSIAAMVVNAAFPSIELEYLKQRYNVAVAESQLEKADFDIGFIQAEYAPFLNNENSEIGYSAGINIPIFRKNKPQIAERMLDEIERKERLGYETTVDSVNKALEYGYLLSLSEHHKVLRNEIERLKIDELFTALAQSENNNPIAILELQFANFDVQELLIESKYELLKQYLDFLYVYDAIIQQPLRNFLSSQLTSIE